MGYPSDDVFEEARRDRRPPAMRNLRPSFDLVAHLYRQREFSARTFGPGARTAGICDHIRKELDEVAKDPTIREWVDVIILALDGAWRSGATPEEIVAAIEAKQAKNEARTWPDWHTVPEGKAIEHDRTAECPPAKGEERAHCTECNGAGSFCPGDPSLTCARCNGTGVEPAK